MSHPFFSTSKNILSLLTVLFLSVFSQVDAASKTPSHPKAMSFAIDYKESSSELCRIGAKYDTDDRHCPPSTLFYNSLFKDKRAEELVIAELGILYGASLRMWQEYFTNATIYGFEYDRTLIDSFKKTYDTDRIELTEIDVTDSASIQGAFRSTGVQYDLIIDDTTHPFKDQLRVIKNAYPFLKPGGMLIIEDIPKSRSEQVYINRLKPILDQFQDYYFVSMDHKNRCSTKVVNDKVFVLVKAGGMPIFKNQKKMTIITPSIRPSNLPKIKDSIDFDYVDEWIIVYDGKKISENPLVFKSEGNPKIKEYIHTSEMISGNGQRNYAIDHIQNEDTYLHFLDDDNTIHKDLYKLLDIIDDGRIYTFDQKDRITGNHIEICQIDTAMFLVDFKLCKAIRWVSEFTADFYYINDCYLQNKDNWIYVGNALCNYNTLPK